MLKPQVYISGSLTDLTEDKRVFARARYVKIGEACEAHGYTSYVPHLVSDPITAKHLTPKQVNDLDRKAVTDSKLMVADMNDTSHGVGIEIEIANHAKIPVILVYEESKRVSRLALGNPAVHATITYSSEDELFTKLDQALRELEASSPNRAA